MRSAHRVVYLVSFPLEWQVPSLLGRRAAWCLAGIHGKQHIGNAIEVAPLDICGVTSIVVAPSNVCCNYMAILQLHVGLVSVSTSCLIMKVSGIFIHVHLWV